MPVLCYLANYHVSETFTQQSFSATFLLEYSVNNYNILRMHAAVEFFCGIYIHTG